MLSIDVLATLVALLISIAVNVALTLYTLDRAPRWLRRLIDRMRPHPEIPAYTDEAVDSQREYLLRAFTYLQPEDGRREDLGLTQTDNPVSPALSIVDESIDCMCTALVQGGRTCLLMPSPVSGADSEGAGRTALTVRMLGLHLPYTQLLGLCSRDLPAGGTLDISFRPTTHWRLISSDMAYLSVSDGRLTVVPMRGEKISFLWDLARHLLRSGSLDYTRGAHRKSPARELLIELFYSLPWRGLSGLYAGIGQAQRIDEIVFVRRKCSPEPGPTAVQAIVGGDRRHRLEDSLVLASEQHGSPFWKRSASLLRKRVRWLLDAVPDRELPTMSEVVLSSASASIPGYLYDEAVAALMGGVPPGPDRSLVSELRMGIAAHNQELLTALPTISTLRMLVLSGEKVFRDAAFWRHLAADRRAVHVEILLLNPASPAVSRIQETAYGDKQADFLRSEIEGNIEALRKVSAAFSKEPFRVSLSCWVYGHRPAVRMTLLDDARALVAPYLTYSRTGDQTVFTDIRAASHSTLVGALLREFEQVKSNATLLRLT